jgi:phage head maturation protease
MDGGELDAMSFAFYVVRQMWSPDYEQRDITEIDLDGGDTSVVTHPANPATTGTTA